MTATPDPSVARLLTTDPARAAQCLADGGLVGIPTETVYGLAGDAASPTAVARIFATKRRPTDHPLIVHAVRAEVLLDGWVAEPDEAFFTLAEACWPGPLTMLVRRGPKVIDAVTGGRATVGVRVPAHPLTAAALERFGGAVAAPSANMFGRVSPTTAAHVVADLGDLLDPARDCVLDGGPAAVGVESTIVDLTVSPPQVLRAGAIDAATVTRLLATPVAPASGPSRAAGMLAAHYAPRTEVLLAERADDAAEIAAAVESVGKRATILDRTADLVEAARQLYGDLRAADAEGFDAIVVVLPRPEGLGIAIRDRLERAARATHPPAG